MSTLAGRYELKETLGGGSFAITHLARDIMQPSKPLCVVKQLRPNQTHPRVIDFFHKEATILEKLGKHPQIPRLLAHFQEDDNLYIVQEFIQGHDLSREICHGKRLSEDYVREFLQDVLEVLSFVHKYGVIHRDIKPPNLMRRQEDGKIFLIDFGAVKELGTLMVNTKGEVKSSVVIGTPGFMPNEQGSGKPCLASDIYAVGMSAIAALTGIQPHELEEDTRTGEVIWLDKVQVSQDLARIVTKMVRRHHSLRYSYAKDVLQELLTVGKLTVIAPTELNPPIPPLITVPKFQVVTPKPVPKAQPNPPIPGKLSRRKTLQILSFVGGGLLIAVVGKELFQRRLSNEVITVDASGNIIKRQTLNANYFEEDLGNGITLEMAEIPGNEFLMGSPDNEEGRIDDENPQHRVTVKPFFMGKFAVTQVQYQAIMGKNPSLFRGNKRPVERVSWNDAIEFCQKLTEKTGRRYCLPSEAEWEYACRAGTTKPFHFGETITTDLVNFNGNATYADAKKGKYRKQTTEVGSFLPNAFGLYDMHGNVWEWCEDSYHKNYYGAPSDGSALVKNDNYSRRVLRGGSWLSQPPLCRSASRDYDRALPGNLNHSVGFRVVYTVEGDS